jgi:hypothetical protein
VLGSGTLLDGYYDAFYRFLRSGTPSGLADYCDENTDLAILDVYRNGFFRTCTNVLRSNYPSVDHLVGEACFTALARRYIEAHPPRQASLVAYGADFAHLIRDTQDFHQLAYLACIATLDRAWTEIYFAEDTEGPAAEVLAGLTAAAFMDLSGRLAPSVRLVSLEFDALDAWTRLRQGALREPMEIRRRPLGVLIWRCGEDISYRALSGAEHTFVAAIVAGRPCAEAALAAVDSDAAFDTVTIFASLLHERLLTFER